MKILTWDSIRHYNKSDFVSPDTKEGWYLMDLNLIHFLDTFEDKHKHHFTVISGFRSASHNLKVGGVSNSSHLIGKAVDVICCNSLLRYKLIYYALSCRIKRIGISQTFMHIDTNYLLPYPLIWVY